MDRSRNTRRHKFRITGRRSRCFLEALAETGNVTAAAAAAGISRGGAYDHRQIDDAFANGLGRSGGDRRRPARGGSVAARGGWRLGAGDSAWENWSAMR